MLLAAASALTAAWGAAARAGAPETLCALGLRYTLMEEILSEQRPRMGEKRLRLGPVDLSVLSKPYVPGESGGDFFKLVPRIDGRFSILMADVEGHGPASTVDVVDLNKRVSNRAFVRAISGKDAAFALVYLDQRIRPRKLLTMAHLLVDPRTGLLEYANAGLPYLRVLKSSGEVVEVRADGLFVGEKMRELSYSAEHSEKGVYQLEAGDEVYFVTDGATAARIEAMTKVKGGTSEKVEAVFEEVGPQQDDVTVLVLKWDPSARGR